MGKIILRDEIDPGGGDQSRGDEENKEGLGRKNYWGLNGPRRPNRREQSPSQRRRTNASSIASHNVGRTREQRERSAITTLEDPPNVFVVDCTSCVPTHGGYRRAIPVYEHWQRVLKGTPLPRYASI